MDLAKQYNNFADDFSRLANGDDYLSTNKYSKEVFYEHINFIKDRDKILDLACGDGNDMIEYRNKGGVVYGFDASEDLIEIAKNNIPDADFKVGLFENLPYESDSFDIVLSKYALQTSPSIEKAFSEIYRVLKQGGVMMYLTVHPFRQYFERKNGQSNYFEQVIVDSHVFQNQITFKEPTHIMTEYLSPFLFKNFDVQMFDERWEPCAEQIDGRKYPGFMIIKAIKR